MKNNNDRNADDKIQTREGGVLEFTFFGHASLAMNFDGHEIYVDPLEEYADYSALPKADIILITHDHYDHLDVNAVSALKKEGTIIIANESSAAQLGEGIVMRNGDVLDVTDYLTVEAVPAYNTTPDREQFHPNDGSNNGYILTLGGERIYIAGDSEDTPQMKALRDIDVAFLPVNQPYTMTVEQAERAARAINPRIFYPYHTGDTDIEPLKESLSDTEIDVRIRDLK